jgi:N-sulfoglucosamine sulfohydrolase
MGPGKKTNTSCQQGGRHREVEVQKREFLKAGVAASVFGCLAAATASAKPAKSADRSAPKKTYNLLFITLDDMNWSMPGFMGGKAGLTPNLDKLAARSMRFVNCRAAVPICQPSREAMMTGLLPQHSGATGFTPVYEGTPTLASILHDAGYFTASIHKIGHMLPLSCFPWDYFRPGKDRSPKEYETQVRISIDAAKAKGKPFFVCCNINDPHRPFYGSPEAAKIDNNQEGDYKIPHEIGSDEVTVPPFLEDLPDIRKELAQYSNSVQRLDISIGKIFKVVEDSGCAGNTIVFFSSDHGMPFPFAKATGYDSGSRTPALLYWPGMGRGRSFTELACNIDYLPTLLDLMGLPQPERIDGRSWMPLIKGAPWKDRDYVVTSVNSLSSGISYPTRTIQNMKFALVFSPWADGKFKYSSESMFGLTFGAMVEAAKTNANIAARVEQLTVGTPLAFYDLEADPGQRVNLIASPKYQDKIKEMQTHLRRQMEQTGDPQLENFNILLAGGKPKVVQFPKIYRIEDHTYEFPPDGNSDLPALKAIAAENRALLAGQ